MKNKLAALITAAVFLTPIYPVYAQTPTTGSALTRPMQSTMSAARKEAAVQKLETRLEKMASREAALKTKLLRFRDKQKAQTVERINANLATVNSNKTSALLTQLERMTQVLTNLESRLNQAVQTNQDTSTAIQDAKSAISAAKQLVEAQQQKDYTIEVSTEQTVKADAKTTRDLLFTDLKAMHDSVKSAKEAVVQAIQTASGGVNAR